MKSGKNRMFFGGVAWNAERVSLHVRKTWNIDILGEVLVSFIFFEWIVYQYLFF
jgi:hypothetical protein